MNELLLMRIDCDPPVLAWSGDGPLAVPYDTVNRPALGLATEGGDSLVAEGASLFYGVGGVADWPEIELLVNGQAQRVSFTFSGATPRMLRLAREDAATVRFAPAWLGTLRLDDDLQPTGPVEWEAKLICDSLTVAGASVAEENDLSSRILTVTLSAASADTARRRAKNTYFTDADQKRRSPTDRFFDRIAMYSAGTTVRWGLRD